MQNFGAKRDLGRIRAGGEEARVEYVELFFDLVFVFAVTQISHSLLAHLTLTGALQSAFLLLAVWWVWVFTSWVTNWMDPRRSAVKLMLFTLMLAGLVLSSSLPEAFEQRGLAFAAAYVFMQLGRSAFMLWALRHHNPANFLNFVRIIQWFAVSGLFWLAGAFVEGEARFGLWIAALAIEYAGPALGFRTPWNGASATTDWTVDGGHMAERSALFIIIALGESVLVTGATFAAHEWTAPLVLAFLASFAGTVAMWWLYFAIGADIAHHNIEHSDDPGRVARVAFTYVPVLLVAGIVVAAVADELVLAHPLGHHAEPAMILTVVGGPALYVIGNMLFKYVAFGRPPLSHMVGLGLFVVLAAVAWYLEPLPLSIAATMIIIIVAAWEFISMKSLRRRPDPAPEQLPRGTR